MTHKEWIDNFRGNTGRLPSQVELSKSLKISPNAAIKLLLEATHPEKKRVNLKKVPIKLSQVFWLKTGMFAVAGFTFILSIYFTSLWFRSMFSFVIASLISVSMVTYMVLSPQVVRHTKGAVKIPLYITFLIALIFSMGSTIAGQYGKLTDNVDLSVVRDHSLYNTLVKTEEELQEKIKTLSNEKAFHMETMRNLGSTAEDRMSNYSYISTERRKVEEYTTLIAEEEARLIGVREEIKMEIESGSTGIVEEEDDFFTWIAGILNADETMVQFWIYTLPAVFIDLIAALCLNLALYIKEKPSPE